MIDQRAAQRAVQLLEALQVALVADPHLVHAPIRLEAQPLGNLSPLVVGRDAVLTAQLLDQLEELVEVDVGVANGRSPVDRGAPVIHVLVQLRHWTKHKGIKTTITLKPVITVTNTV